MALKEVIHKLIGNDDEKELSQDRTAEHDKLFKDLQSKDRGQPSQKTKEMLDIPRNSETSEISDVSEVSEVSEISVKSNESEVEGTSSQESPHKHKEGFSRAKDVIVKFFGVDDKKESVKDWSEKEKSNDTLTDSESDECSTFLNPHAINRDIRAVDHPDLAGKSSEELVVEMHARDALRAPKTRSRRDRKKKHHRLSKGIHGHKERNNRSDKDLHDKVHEKDRPVEGMNVKDPLHENDHLDKDIHSKDHREKHEELPKDLLERENHINKDIHSKDHKDKHDHLDEVLQDKDHRDKQELNQPQNQFTNELHEKVDDSQKHLNKDLHHKDHKDKHDLLPEDSYSKIHPSEKSNEQLMQEMHEKMIADER